MTCSNCLRKISALTAGMMLLAGCANRYGPNEQADWEARHMEAHRHMMAYGGDMACDIDGHATGARMGPGMGRGVGPSAMTPEQRREWMAARIKAMPPEVIRKHLEVMEMQMQLMREQLASQPTGK